MSEALSVFAVAAAAPAQEALVVDGRCIAFAALARRGGRAPHALAVAGAGPAAPVALSPRLDLATVTWIHAALALGARLGLLEARRVAVRTLARR